jgi:hypothetical protein
LTARTLKEYWEFEFKPEIITFDSVSAYPFVEITGSVGLVLCDFTTYQKICAVGRVSGGVQDTTAVETLINVANTVDGATDGGRPGWNSRKEASGP